MTSNAVQASANGREYVLLFVLSLIWSTSFLLIKIGVETVPPITLSFLRLGVGAILLLLFALWSGAGLPKSRQLWLIAAFVGVFGNVLPNTLIHWGEQTIDSGLAALFMGVMPVWVIVLAHFFAGEPITVKRACGVLLAFFGLSVLVGWEVLSDLGNDALAQTAVIMAAICYAITTIFVRRQGSVPMRSVAAGSLLVGTVLLLPLAFLIEAPDFALFSIKSTIAIVLLGIFQTAIAAILYFYLIARVGANIFSQINYLIPVMGIAWGILLLGEQPGWREVIALLCIMSGLLLVNQRQKA